MEKFDCCFMTSRELVSEYSEVIKRCQRRTVTTNIIALLFVVLSVPAAFTTAFYEFVFLSVIGIVILLCNIVRGVMRANTVFNDSLATVRMDYSFENEEFRVTDNIHQSFYKYNAVKQIIESRNLIILRLYSGQDILIHTQAMLQNDLLLFRQFLTAKTNKKIKKMKSFLLVMPRSARVPVVFAVCVSVIIAAAFVNDFYFNRRKDFEIEGYSITAAKKFVATDDEVYSLYLKNTLDDTAIRAYNVTDTELESYGDESNITVYEYAERYIASTLFEPTEDSVEEIDSDHVFVQMTEVINNDSYYCLKVVTKRDSVYWITEFTCTEDMYESYFIEFLEYAQTIK